ncbi:MAG: hypothetical protein A2W18_12400 [Candidatus Muproteobacteria bacterium RBG_16_60_9]|uniref:Uncharacterized protein n=1 Tax=Candidatus Muproteobacteria bacterium RBG_16_60_9 TaxID=1817755 RepID=A0A1F6UVF3_9PROT|nr:MAG: hypothetical protein A2W18_12400 [Candidatus Muproteobacteria bacterium RBG_16_60_9]
MPRFAVLRPQQLHARQMFAQLLRQYRRHHGHTILVALALAHQYFVALEVNILHPQPHAFHQAHAGAVDQPRHQPLRAVEVSEQALHLARR